MSQEFIFEVYREVTFIVSVRAGSEEDAYRIANLVDVNYIPSSVTVKETEAHRAVWPIREGDPSEEVTTSEGSDGQERPGKGEE